MSGGNVNYHRSPCPGRIFEDLGVGFSIGCAGGSMFYFLKGIILVSSLIIIQVSTMHQDGKE
jgi:hypothetical protein